jgi:cleavage and polyadenylation specificity factor subunit 2
VTKDEGAPSSHHNNPPFFATYPTLKMGQMTMYDHHASLSLDGHNPGYSLEDVDAVFSTDSFTTLKYSQTVYLPMIGGDNNKEGATTVAEGNVGLDNKPHTVTTPLLAITPHLSGHVVGGCYWILRRLSDDATVVLAPTYHHAKEKHLAGSTLHTFGINADALVTMPGGPRGLLGKLYLPPPVPSSSLPPTSSATTTTAAAQENDYHKLIKYNTNKKPILSPPMGNRSESELIESVMAALRRDGNVLLPVDASGRVLELLLILDKHWEKQRLSGAYNLIWVSPMSPNTIEYARSQLEWMAPPLGAQFDSQRGHPYALKHVSICSSISEMEYVIRNSNGNPTTVLASGASMDHGPARDLLLKWGGNPDNLILITNSTRCVPRGEVWFYRHMRGSGGGSGEESKLLSQSYDSVGAIGIVAEEAVDVTASTAADTDDKEGNEQQASLVGPALQPDSVSAYTTASQLLYQWCAAKASGTEMPDEIIVDVYVPHRAPLRGAELQAFLAEEERELRSRQAEMEEKAMMKEIELARGRLRLGVGEGEEAIVTTTTVSSDTAGDVQSTVGGASKVSSTSGKTTALAGGGGLSSSSSSRPKKKSRFDQKLFIKFSKPVHSESQYVCFRDVSFLHTQCVGLTQLTSSSQ